MKPIPAMAGHVTMGAAAACLPLVNTNAPVIIRTLAVYVKPVS